MYYYELIIKNNKKIYQSRFKYSVDEINDSINKFKLELKTNDIFKYGYTEYDIVEYLACKHGIVIKNINFDYQFSLDISDYLK